MAFAAGDGGPVDDSDDRLTLAYVLRRDSTWSGTTRRSFSQSSNSHDLRDTSVERVCRILLLRRRRSVVKLSALERDTMSSDLVGEIERDFMEDHMPSSARSPFAGSGVEQLSECDDVSIGTGESSDVGVRLWPWLEADDEEPSCGTSTGAVHGNTGCVSSGMVGLLDSQYSVRRTGDVGDDSRSKWNDERMVWRRVLRGRVRLSVDFLRRRSVRGEPAPGSCMAPTLMSTLDTITSRPRQRGDQAALSFAAEACLRRSAARGRRDTQPRGAAAHGGVESPAAGRGGRQPSRGERGGRGRGEELITWLSCALTKPLEGRLIIRRDAPVCHCARARGIVSRGFYSLKICKAAE